MAIVQDYVTGTASVANGDTAVTGAGTAWDTGTIRAGDLFMKDGYGVVIASVTDNTHLTLAENWPGTALAASAYRIRFQPDGSRYTAAAVRLVEMLGGGGFFQYDAAGSLADRDAYDDKLRGFSFLDVTTDPMGIYVKASDTAGDWAGPSSYVQGEKGDKGDIGNTGPSGTITSATATGLAAGAAPTITLGGTASARTMEFGIPKGDKGGTGDTGPSGTITSATATALDPGDAPSVTLGGTPAARTMDFGIPSGRGFNFKGAYSGSTAYVLDDVVRDNGSSWIALQATTGNAPPVYPTTSNAYWELTALKGTDGTGTGDVVGPASAPNGNLAIFDGTTGKLVKDGGVAVSDIAKTVSGLPTNGTTDALAILIAAQTASDVIRVPPGTYFLSDQIDILDGKQWILDNVELIHGDDTKSLFSASGKSGWSIAGSWKLTGLRTASETGTECGLVIDDCSDYRVEGGRFAAFKGKGLWVNGTNSPTEYGGKGQFSDLLASGCAEGYRVDPGSGAEYGTWSNCSAVGNDSGVVMGAGSHTWSGGTITNNGIGVQLIDGTNHCHGVFSGTLINHNTKNIEATGVTYGHTFSGCYITASPGAGTIELIGCKGVVFEGGAIDVGADGFKNDGGAGSGFNYVKNVNFYGATELGTVTGNDAGKLQFLQCTGNISRDINAQNPHYISMYRGSETQAVSSETTLIFPNELTNRNGDYDASTGEWTCPESGRYRIIFDALVNGTSLDETASYIDVQVYGTAWASFMLCLPTKFGAGKLRFAMAFDVGLAAGNKLRLLATMSSSGATFDDPNWLSMLSVEKVG